MQLSRAQMRERERVYYYEFGFIFEFVGSCTTARVTLRASRYIRSSFVSLSHSVLVFLPHSAETFSPT